ncbi:YggT family protein [Sinimarinibacterium sp. CAU 1509]|uniref:YggT family protein n=1 Tax=Sinimarinibacterium sp. CAU 1509 TaxID=2562283 RepID=UPI0010AD2A59|nr:YggT family protein [Sinimarinibacterium sp. CAU 1509]TJY59373.1 YggT family protein [Sinimarinibacterium sp. CAU 1509]
MGANASNAALFLLTTLFDLVLWLFMLRIILQWVRADFYNPISQGIWRATRYPTDWLRGVIPAVGKLNTGAALVVLAIALIYVYSVTGLLGFGVSVLSAVWFAILKTGVLAVNLYTFTLFVQAIMSWLGPGVNNPASNILWSINEPLLRPVRRIIPPLSGLDLSPLAVILLLQVLNRLLPLPGIFR